MSEKPGVKVQISEDALRFNDADAEDNRELFRKSKVFVVNLMGSPGSGKTTLLERTIPALRDLHVGVVEGDIEGELDRKRVESAGADFAAQINTRGACHLLARQVREALEDVDLEKVDVLFVENVGNLVCPAEFDLGESACAMVLGVTEGADKPLKYPLMFKESQVLVLNKVDLADLSGCDIEELKANAETVNPEMKMIELSCRTGEGTEDWIAWIRESILASRI